MKNVVTVRFIQNGGLISRAIAWGTNSLFSHVEFGTPEGTWIGAHLKGGVQERAADYCHPVRDYRYNIPLASREELVHWLTILRRDIGMKYNAIDILGLAIHARRFNNTSNVICSEWATNRLIEYFGVYAILNVGPTFEYLITPETLHLSPIFVGRRVYRKG